MNIPMTSRPLTLLAALLTAGALAAPAWAKSPPLSVSERSELRPAQGQYLLADGRTLSVQVGHSVNVAVGDEEPKTWRTQGADVLVSGDGRLLRLLRSVDGTVERIELRTPRQH